VIINNNTTTTRKKAKLRKTCDNEKNLRYW
jgi:hypothetical protein